MPEESTNSPTISNPMPKALTSVINSVLTRSKSSKNSESGPQEIGQNITIGGPLSAEALDALRDIARRAGQDHRQTDASLEALFRQHFGQRLDIKRRMKPCCDAEGGYDEWMGQSRYRDWRSGRR